MDMVQRTGRGTISLARNWPITQDGEEDRRRAGSLISRKAR